MEQLALKSVSRALPVELLCETILVYLVDCFMDLVTQPSVEKFWDPLSSPLHTSVRFRDITAGLLRNIYGEVSSREPGESTLINYRHVLAKLNRIHAFAFTDDPEAPWDSDSIIACILIDPQDLKSPLICVAVDFAIAQRRARICEPSSAVTLADTFRTNVTPEWRWQPWGHVATSISWRVLAPIAQLGISLQSLVMRSFTLTRFCDVALVFDSNFWLEPDYAAAAERPHSELLNIFETVDKTVQHMLTKFKMCNLHIDGLPIPMHIVKSAETHAALLHLEPPPGRSKDEPLVQFCRGAQDAILRQFYPEQRDVVSAELIKSRTSRLL